MNNDEPLSGGRSRTQEVSQARPNVAADERERIAHEREAALDLRELRIVAHEARGRKLGEKITTATTTADHLDMLRWAEQFGPERRWAVEDCRHLSRRLERDLLAAGEAIVRVPPKMMAGTRTRARTYGKSDPIDASRWLAPRCRNQTCQQRVSTVRRVRCGCWWIIATTWCRNAPG
jgi:transposase